MRRRRIEKSEKNFKLQTRFFFAPSISLIFRPSTSHLFDLFFEENFTPQHRGHLDDVVPGQIGAPPVPVFQHLQLRRGERNARTIVRSPLGPSLDVGSPRQFRRSVPGVLKPREIGPHPYFAIPWFRLAGYKSIIPGFSRDDTINVFFAPCLSLAPVSRRLFFLRLREG